MNSYVIVLLVTILILSVVSSSVTYNVAWSDKKYCYDQIGDGHFCFDTKKECKPTKVICRGFRYYFKLETLNSTHMKFQIHNYSYMMI